MKQVDHNGQFEYSDVIAIEKSAIGKIIPNPAEHFFRITIGNDMSSLGGILSVTDMQGRLIKRIDISQGTPNLLEVSINDMKQGVYQVTLHSRAGILVSTQRLMVE